MASVKKSEDCKYGAACKYYSSGKCFNRHPPMKKIAPKTLDKVPKALKPKLTRCAMMHMGRSLHAKRKTLDAAVLLVKTPPALEKGWLAVPDVKMSAPSPEYLKMLQDSFDAEMKLARGALASVYGSKPVPFVIPVQTSFTCTVTTGLLSATSDIKFADSAECTTALAILFDEYRISHAHYDFAIFTPTSSIVLGTSSLTALANAGIAFDPADATAATVTTDITALQYHLIVYPRTIVGNGSAGSSATNFIGAYGKLGEPYTLRWKYQDDSMFTGNGGAVGPGMWKATTGNTGNFPDGTIKTLYQTGETTAQITYAGTMYRTILFRNRT